MVPTEHNNSSTVPQNSDVRRTQTIKQLASTSLLLQASGAANIAAHVAYTGGMQLHELL
jgi:hypothetical protein